jgi:hypothetical protein
LDSKPHVGGAIAPILVIVAGLGYAACSIVGDINQVGEHNLAIGALVLLGLALLIAMGFDFVNGFMKMVTPVAGREAAGHLCQTFPDESVARVSSDRSGSHSILRACWFVRATFPPADIPPVQYRRRAHSFRRKRTSW